MPRPNYDIIALDLDGTLLGPDGVVSQPNRDAIDTARDAGIEVVICTGRGFKESNIAVDAIDARTPAAGRDIAPIVTSGGAMIVDAATGDTLHRWPVAQPIVRDVCQLFADLGRAPLILKDAHAAGFDYLVIETGPIEPPTHWWFDAMPVTVRRVPSIEHDEHPEHTVRVGFAADRDTMRELATRVRDRFESRVLIHSFAAVSGVKTPAGATNVVATAGAKDDDVHLLEIFDASVSKWTAISELARQQGIPRERVAAIGDEINDLAMIQAAGLGIAMGNAIPPVKDAAHKVAESNAHDGVAHSIRRILDAEW